MHTVTIKIVEKPNEAPAYIGEVTALQLDQCVITNETQTVDLVFSEPGSEKKKYISMTTVTVIKCLADYCGGKRQRDGV